MRATKILMVIYILSLGLSMTSCRRNSNEVWEDSKTAGRHMSRGLRSMGGKHGSSRAVQNAGEFMPMNDESYPVEYMDIASAPQAPITSEFVPMGDQIINNDVAMGDFVSPQPRNTPGDPGSPIPGISAFQDPSVNPTWAAIFKNITFEYNSNLVKGSENLDTARRVADYMKNHRDVYVFVEGHCDERGPEAYNLALGSRRSNAVRNFLIQEGVNPDNIFSISYGKERPLFLDHHEEAWGQNRRAEFKIYQR